MRSPARLVIVVAGTFLVATACGGGSDAEPVRVFAAASLTDAFTEVETAFEDANPGVDVQLNLAGSSTLREQILQGAPADVFASADQSNMTLLAEAGELAEQPQTFARNRLQIAVPAGNPGSVRGLEDFAKPHLLIGLCLGGVPCGDLASKVFSEAGIEPSLDTEEPSVRALLAKIVAGELDAGMVYVTDVSAAQGDVEPVGASTSVAASYPVARLAEAPNSAAAEAFVAFVLSEPGQAILADYGFEAP